MIFKLYTLSPVQTAQNCNKTLCGWAVYKYMARAHNLVSWICHLSTRWVVNIWTICLPEHGYLHTTLIYSHEPFVQCKFTFLLYYRNIWLYRVVPPWLYKHYKPNLNWLNSYRTHTRGVFRKVQRAFLSNTTLTKSLHSKWLNTSFWQFVA